MSGTYVFFQGDTLVLSGAGEHDLVPSPPFCWIRGVVFREAYHYAKIAGTEEERENHGEINVRKV
jgi:hypothetical protein